MDVPAEGGFFLLPLEELEALFGPAEQFGEPGDPVLGQGHIAFGGLIQFQQEDIDFVPEVGDDFFGIQSPVDPAPEPEPGEPDGSKAQQRDDQ